MANHSRRSKKMYGKPSQVSPLSKLVSSQGKSPSAFLGKETVVQDSPREVQAIENVYEFFTKQRPLAWNYYSATVYEPMKITGNFWRNNQPIKIPIRTLDVNESLVLNHFEATILYRPIPEGTAVSDIKNGYFVALDTPMIPLGLSTGSSGSTPTGFLFNLVAEEASLYEAESRIQDVGSGSLRKDRNAPTSGFLRLNTNVLESGESTTSLYVFETGTLSAEYSCVVQPGAVGDPPTQILPYGLVTGLPVNDLRFGITIVFNVRGHVINRNDAALLKTLIQNN